MLSALALVLSYMETFIPLPVPVPGAKLGLANIPVLMALSLLDAKSALAIALTKTLATGLLLGSPLMIPYSAAGTLLAYCAMLALMRVRGLSVALVSVAGSICHIAGQLLVAWLMLGTPLVFYSFPLLALIACATGALTGKVAASLIAALSDPLSSKGTPCGNAGESEGKSGKRLSGNTSPGTADNRVPNARREVATNRRARMLLTLLVVYFVVTLCARSTLVLSACLAIAAACALASRVKPKEAARALGPLLSILVITAVAQVLYVQQGTVVAELGPISLTVEALETIAVMMVRLVSLMLASVAFTHAVSADELASALAFYLRPLKRLGIRTDAFLLSLNLAFQFLPVLLAEFKQLRAERDKSAPTPESNGFAAKLRSYQGIATQLAISSFAFADEIAAQYAGIEAL